MNKETSSPTHSRRKAARPQEIMDAALALFAEKGYAATKMEDIAKRAGVTRGTPYLYFQSKDDLFREIVRTSVLPAVTLVQQVVSEAQDQPISQILSDIQEYWHRQVLDTPRAAVLKLMMCESGNFPEVALYYREQVIEPFQALLQALIQQGIATGEFRASVDAEYAVYTLMAPMLSAVIWKYSFACNAPIEFDRLFATATDLLRHGMLTPVR